MAHKFIIIVSAELLLTYSPSLIGLIQSTSVQDCVAMWEDSPWTPVSSSQRGATTLPDRLSSSATSLQVCISPPPSAVSYDAVWGSEQHHRNSEQFGGPLNIWSDCRLVWLATAVWRRIAFIPKLNLFQLFAALPHIFLFGNPCSPHCRCLNPPLALKINGRTGVFAATPDFVLNKALNSWGWFPCKCIIPDPYYVLESLWEYWTFVLQKLERAKVI